MIKQYSGIVHSLFLTFWNVSFFYVENKSSVICKFEKYRLLRMLETLTQKFKLFITECKSSMIPSASTICIWTFKCFNYS